jgi:hypothetical protein
LTTRKSGRGTIQQYELTNLLFLLVLIVALTVLVALLINYFFNHYKNMDAESSGEEHIGVVSETLSSTSDVGMFYLGTKISETGFQYRNRIDIPVTDDGFLKELFSLPGVEEVAINPKTIMLKKNHSARWEAISPGVKRIAGSHLHIHY